MVRVYQRAGSGCVLDDRVAIVGTVVSRTIVSLVASVLPARSLYWTRTSRVPSVAGRLTPAPAA